MRLDARQGEFLAHLVSASIHREYPNKVAHLLEGDEDVRPPRQLTPMFYGCFDWHSAVHSHWALVRLVRLHPGERWAGDLRIALSDSFTADRVGGELAYLVDRPAFEMPYGMAWLLQLDAELREGAADPLLASWQAVLGPLAGAACRRFTDWVGGLRHPIRGGEHSQTAFAMGLALDWARTAGDRALADLLAEQTRAFYHGDRDAPLAYEPSAHDFLSPSLAEADLMRRVLGSAELEIWLAGFLPDGIVRLTPVAPLDRSDGKLVHFDGLNLSRAWMMRGVASALPAAHPLRAALAASAAAHETAGMTGLGGSYYAGTHWLGSFAVYLQSERGLATRAAAGPG